MQLGKTAGLELCDKPLRNIFGDALLDLAKANPKVVVLTCDLTNSVRAEAFKNKFPDRFFQFGVAEQNMMGIAAGMSLTGYILSDERGQREASVPAIQSKFL